MSLKIKSISYHDIYIDNSDRLEVFYKDVKTIVSKGYSVSIGIYATNTVANLNSTSVEDCADVSCTTFSYYNPPAASTSTEDEFSHF